MIKNGGARRLAIYAALEDINYEWSAAEIDKFLTLWLQGWSLQYICGQLERDIDEAAVLMMDLDEKMGLFPARGYGVKVSPPIEEDTLPLKYDKMRRSFLKRYRGGYTAFLEHSRVNFIWGEREVEDFEEFWYSGYTLQAIAKKLKRHYLDVALLVLDRKRKGRIEVRESGLEGWKEDVAKKVCRKANRHKSAAC
ncbi:hypothetical protein [Bacillus infantis]|uniref:hypothetical protein n=1 Tax=Bacillus infantis TaxID=324767 RepID=UPI001653AC28|nr:hypothetical protein [Bacillus infantis]